MKILTGLKCIVISLSMYALVYELFDVFCENELEEGELGTQALSGFSGSVPQIFCIMSIAVSVIATIIAIVMEYNDYLRKNNKENHDEANADENTDRTIE